jgi:hypothetical protein
MYKGKFIIGCNKNKSVESIYSNFIKDESIKFSEKLIALAKGTAKAASSSRAMEAFRVKRHATKLTRELEGARGEIPGLDLSIFQDEGEELCVKFDVAKDMGDELAEFLKGTGEMSEKKVALICGTGMNMWHAEQKILIGLCKAVKAGFDPKYAEIIFAGTFRPCRGCWESLNVVQKFCYPHLQFGARPGHFWQTTTKAHTSIINILRESGHITAEDLKNSFKSDGSLAGLRGTATHRMYLRTKKGEKGQQALHFNSDSESDTDD